MARRATCHARLAQEPEKNETRPKPCHLQAQTGSMSVSKLVSCPWCSVSWYTWPFIHEPHLSSPTSPSPPKEMPEALQMSQKRGTYHGKKARGHMVAICILTEKSPGGYR